jgi:hypothetical protein
MNKIPFKKVYSAFFLFLAVWIGTGLLAPLIAPDLAAGRLLFGGGIPVSVFLSFYLTKGKQRIIPAAIITTVILSWLYITGFGNIEQYARGYLNGFRETTAFQAFNIYLAGMVLLPIMLIIERSFRMRIATASGLLIYLTVGLFMEWELGKSIVCLCILYILLVLTELLQQAGLRKKITVFLLPFLILYFILILIVPTKEEPYDWKFAKTIYGNIRQAVVTVSQRLGDAFEGGRGGFTMEVSGFSGKGVLGSGFSGSSDREVMNVTLTKGKRMSVYLTGNVFDTFNGDIWTAEAYETEYDHLLDLVEIMYAIYRYDSENFDDYLHLAEMQVTYSALRTEYLFAPLKVQRASFADGRFIDLREQGGQWNFNERMGYGTSYNLHFYQMNMGQEFFHEMVVAEMGYPYNMEDDFFSTTRYRNNIPADMFNVQTYKERSENIAQQYTKTYPLSDEVREFLAEITRDAENDFEICRALEKTLSGRADIAFTYTKTPDRLPSGKDFIDYFLLESRAGYCTYYATAFVLMARELGLPTRYVQGFLVADEQLGLSTVTVTDSMAHAWPEVYFQGVGWIPFEPTPGFGSGRYRYWEPASPIPMADSPYDMPSQYEEPPYISELPDTLMTFEGSSDNRWLEVMLVVTLTLFIAGATIIIIDKLLKRRHYQRLSVAERFLEQVRLNLQIMGMIGYNLLPGETIAEFAGRIKKTETGLSLDFVILLERMIYRGDLMADEALVTVQNDREELYRMIRQANKWRYYFIRFRVSLAPGG